MHITLPSGGSLVVGKDFVARLRPTRKRQFTLIDNAIEAIGRAVDADAVDLAMLQISGPADKVRRIGASLRSIAAHLTTESLALRAAAAQLTGQNVSRSHYRALPQSVQVAIAAMTAAGPVKRHLCAGIAEQYVSHADELAEVAAAATQSAEKSDALCQVLEIRARGLAQERAIELIAPARAAGIESCLEDATVKAAPISAALASTEPLDINAIFDAAEQAAHRVGHAHTFAAKWINARTDVIQRAATADQAALTAYRALAGYNNAGATA